MAADTAPQTKAIQRGATGDRRPSPLEIAHAFGVMAGPSLVLYAGVAVGIASTLRALRRRRSPRLSAVLTTALAGAYATVARPLILHWGATCAELREPLPGDELVPDPLIQSTRAVTVDAAVDAVWPWLIEIPHFVMERKMLLGLKQRAERPHAATDALPAA